MNLTYATPNSATLRVDTSETNAVTGRKSVRIESKNQYNDGLFLFDILHTPYGCGTWPSVWLADPANWPNHGEIGKILLRVLAPEFNSNYTDQKRRRSGSCESGDHWEPSDFTYYCRL